MANPHFVIALAGVNIRINPLHEEIYHHCRGYLSHHEGEITIAVTEAELAAEHRKSAAEDRLAGLPQRRFSDAYAETLAVYRKIAEALLQRDILLCHGSAAAVDGQGYLFTAKSGTGKSTHTRLWQARFGERFTMVNDDKPLLSVTDREVRVYGTPWNGKHRRGTNTSTPLKAICLLGRSETNEIHRISGREGYAPLLQQIYRPNDPALLAKTLQLTDRLLSLVALYRLGCNMEPEAAEVSFNGMNGD